MATIPKLIDELQNLYSKKIGHNVISTV